MAKAAVAAASGAGDASPKKKSKLLIIIVAVVLLLAAAGGGAAFFLMSKKKPTKQAGEKEESHETERHGPPVFSALDPFVVNLADPGGERFLQIGISFEVKDNKVAELVKAYTPILRSRILMVLTSKEVAFVNTLEGKQQIMDELLDMARETVQGKEKNKGILDVHFSSFVIQ